MAQLPLALTLERHASLASFVPGSNQAAVEHVARIARGERSESVWLCGARATGKSHLLAAACRAAGDAGLRAMYVRLVPDADPAMLAGLEDIAVLALDDVDSIAGRADWERALFGVLDSRLQQGGLLLAARERPQDSGFALPDLVSRGTAAAVYRLAALDDEELALAVIRQAAARGLEVDAAAAAFLLARLRRDLSELSGWLDRIDRAALAQQRRITIPLLREIIESAPAEA